MHYHEGSLEVMILKSLKGGEHLMKSYSNLPYQGIRILLHATFIWCEQIVDSNLMKVTMKRFMNSFNQKYCIWIRIISN